MASVITNRFKYQLLGWALRGETIPTNFYLALITSATAPTVDTNLFSELTEIAAGNGYSAGGIQISKNATDFDVWTEDDTNDRAYMQLRDMVWTASGGNLPASGDGASYAVMTDDEATQANREVYASFDLVSARTVSDTQSLTLQDCEIRINTPA